MVVVARDVRLTLGGDAPVEILRGVDLDVAAGESVALLGGCSEAADERAASNSAAATETRPRASESVPVAGPKRTILAFGDSLYAGYGLPRGESLPDGIEERLRDEGVDVRIVNAGVSGDTTAGGRRRLRHSRTAVRAWLSAPFVPVAAFQQADG